MASLGFGQAEVDEMELWVIAAVLGEDSRDQSDGGGDDGETMTEEEFARRSRAEAAARYQRLLAERGSTGSLPDGE